ncbi:ABC transporter substrate-binding protein [Rhodococcus triatomae]|uniref:Thiamine pyrimidine synthase n=1 Tax=Rhodococcus triatomae TaxID=300028 RepID=A0A1G8M1T7_9NOCA|nr:ABC transporter substrate-binding protein [Rhodococcus triatomae]QNG18227.1 ABC transporter substrate-binding protein [Rhodococcus triatomae]QNG22102.1 ABC transporter substrate-binding protein [Rhodococcus triatomae]SDI61360.1 ABC-type nitrate/sulfonate/bicarbonate transport system, substrate-binding protein [Rhodococcus triatomae]
MSGAGAVTARHRRRLVALIALVSAALTAVTGCAASGSENTVRFALDWTPNTNHTGLYVAIAEGYFADAGIDVEILPYNDTAPDTLVDSGNAEFGVSFHGSSTFAKAAGANTVSVLAPLQRWATAIGVRADSDVTRPSELDGTTYAGFGNPDGEAVLRQVIRNDGGAGEFETVTLGTSAYEAVYSGTADFTVSFFAWEGIEAEHRGTPMRYFEYTDYGFPESYAILIDANRDWLDENPDRARSFVQALQRGYEYAADHPDEAAQILVDSAPGAFPDEELVRESQRMLAERYMRDANGAVGGQTLEQWRGFSKFLYDSGLLTGPDGNALTEEPDWSTYFTDEYLH